MYHLCIGEAVVPTPKIKFIPVDINADINTIINAHHIITQRLKVMSFIDYVEDSYNDFLKYKETITHPNLHSDITLERKARAYFNEFDIFLDHWKKYMSFRDKKNEFSSVFDKETHEAFDNSSDYALATIIRNYAAHQADVIQGKFWGGKNYYDVGCSKSVLLQDKSLNETKRKVVQDQPAQFISLSPIMRNSLIELKAMHQVFLKFDIDPDDIASAQQLTELIESIANLGLTEKHLYFVNDIKTPLTVYSADNTPLETVFATEQIPFNYKEYLHVLEYLYQ